MKRALIFLLLIGCNTTTINTPIRSFDRPSDVAMICVQFDPATNLLNPRDATDCGPVQRNNLRIPAPGVDGSYFYPRLRALVSQTARGELAEVDIDTAIIIDPEPKVPGFNFYPVGKLPEHVRVSDDGCVAVTSNAGSCDLAYVDLPIVYNTPLVGKIDGGVIPGTDAGLQPDYADKVVRRLKPSVNGKPLGARPSWVELPPQIQKAIRGFDPGGIAGMCRNGKYNAWVALPGCGLVVEVSLDAPDSGNAEVLRALKVTRDGVTPVADLTTLACQDECDPSAEVADLGVSSDGSYPDAGAVNGGPDGGYSRLPIGDSTPTSIAIDFEEGSPTGRLFITDPTNPRFFVVPLDRLTSNVGEPRSLVLGDNALGVNLSRVSPRTQAGKFLYAVARDNTVRVVDLDREIECEANPDPRATVNGVRLLDPIPVDSVDPRADIARFGCIPVGTVARSPLAISPGIGLPNGALAKDVAFVHVDVLQPNDTQDQPLSAGPLVLVGDFAWIISSDGRATAVNIFDACPAPNVPQGVAGAFTPACAFGNIPQSRTDLDLLPGRPQPFYLERLAHRIRQAQVRYTSPLTCTDPAGAARLQDENNPFTITVGNGVGTGTTVVDGGVGVYPTLVPVPLPQPPAAATCPVLQQSVGYQDLDQLHNDTWSVSWEGVVPFTTRASGRFTTGGLLVDPGAAFCSRGALAGDKVYLNGCNTDTDCDYAQTCYRDPGAPSTVSTGLCLDRDQARQDEEVITCAPLLRGIRRYRALSVKQAPAPGVTQDIIKLGEIYQPEHPAETTLCDPTVAKSCDAFPVDGVVDGLPATLPTSCLLDLDGTHRCLRACKVDDPTIDGACGLGFQCAAAHDINNAVGPGRCMRMPLDDRYVLTRELGGYGCLRELQPYEVHSGESFLVTGATSGQLANYEPGPDGECRLPANTSEYVRLRQPRIPLAGVPDCFAAGTNPDPARILTTIIPPTAPGSNVCLFATAEVHFENPYLSFGLTIPPGAPADKYALSFIVIGGGFPLSRTLGVDVTALQPMAAVTSPDLQSVFVVDEGKQSTGSGLRGQLLRLSSIGVATDPGFVVR